MSERKRTAEAEPEGGRIAKKRKVTVKTVQKWVKENDKALDTATWLTFDKLDREDVATLKCSVCIKFEKKLQSTRNYNAAFIVGSTNLRTSSFKDHAATDMHKCAMLLHKKSISSDATEYAPIAKALSTLDSETEAKVKRKFEIACLICKEGLAFTKMSALCQLEEKHGVDLGAGYKNNQACATFVDYIAQAQREVLLSRLAKAKFFSIQADSSTDSGNIEDELFLVQYFDPHGDDGKVHTRDKFLTVRQPNSSNAEGLYECFVRALSYVGVADWESKLIGFGCDGTNVNIGAHGLRGYLEESVPWVVVFWCLAHRLELALKNALQDTLFTRIDEMLLRVYYLYEKSPKKCHQLDDVVASLRLCLEPAELPNKGGNRPLRACGTRFISHKVAAIDRFIDRYGAYISHLIALSEDSSVKSTDKQRLKGFVMKWRDSKMVIGCALFHDILKPAAILCKVLQDDEVSLVGATEALLKTCKAIEKLKTSTFEDLPTVKKIIARVQNTGDEVTYQGAALSKYTEGVAYLKSHKNGYVDSVVSCLKDRVKTQHATLLSDILTLLATQGWEKSENPEMAEAALHRLIPHFQVPLEKAGIDVSLVKEEWDDLTDYAKRYLNLAEEEYRVIWWKLFHAPDAKKWTNILSLIELLFCLPVANGRVERVFSSLKLIKSDRRSSLSEDRLDHLVRIAVDGPPFSEWDSTHAVHLWWKSKLRRQVQDTRATPRPGTSHTKDTTNSEPYTLDLEDWEDFIA